MRLQDLHFYYSHGKLLLTGEYLILHGAFGLALPTIKGQSFTICYYKNKPDPCSSYYDSELLHWNSFDEKDQLWFEGIFQLPSLDICYETEKKTAVRLRNLLLKSREIQKNFLSNTFGIYVKTKLEFPVNWGLGSSSTLISNIAKWSRVKPHLLLEKNFQGSGYDIACGFHSKPIIFRKLKNQGPHVIPINFNLPFKEKLFFLYLNKKQNTCDSIRFFLKKNKNFSKSMDVISDITKKITFCKTLKEFEELLFKHEKIISEMLDIPTIKETYFPDYLGLVKSLGAWGGDFVLISYRDGMRKYFSKKGFHTLISFDKMIIS
ncbi:GYDIA family GHMP kinase [Blattabacterium cuenoti]|uniref:GYDIA family GHMP kinase n=1 Tax=Blattabacterium cuenoti TaxID=1653831 RepID=UPI00163C4EBB|nr:GYDIA family GHMP kinase [Blattabacterium cuenoti]